MLLIVSRLVLIFWPKWQVITHTTSTPTNPSSSSNISLFEFQELSQKIEDLLERLHVSLPSDEHEFLESLYHLTIQRGVDIMSQQLIHQSSVAPLIRFPSAEYRLTFFSNFNKSCTLVDSSQVLAEYAIDSTTPKSLQDKSEGRFVMISTDEMRKRWKKIEDDYRDGHRKHFMRILRAKNGNSDTVKPREGYITLFPCIPF